MTFFFQFWPEKWKIWTKNQNLDTKVDIFWHFDLKPEQFDLENQKFDTKIDFFDILTEKLNNLI